MDGLFGGDEDGGEDNDVPADPFPEDERPNVDPFAEEVTETPERDEVPDQIEHGGFRGEFGVGDSVYSPALSVLIATAFESADDPMQVGARRLTWWEDESLVPKHDFMLINPLTWAQSNPVPEDLTRAVIGADPEEQFVFADSGGFQVKTFDDTCVVDSEDLHDFEKMYVMPEKLLEWQVKNATAGAILDFPPYVVEANSGGTEGIGGLSREEWEEQVWEPNLAQSIENARRAVNHRERIGADDFLLYNVLHGMIPFGEVATPDRYLKKWHAQMSPLGEFDGWCVGVDSGNLGKLALFLGFITDRIDESHLHFLGTSAIPARIVLEFWRVYHKSEYCFTLDSTGFEVGSQYRSFFNPLIHGSDVMVSARSSKNDEKVVIDSDHVPCSCSVCSHMDREMGDRWAWDGNTATEGLAFNMHNLNQLLSRHRMVQSLVESHGRRLLTEWNDGDTSNQAWKIFQKVFSDEQCREIATCMKFIDRVEQNGYEAAKDDFRFASKYDPEHSGPLIEEIDEASFMEW